MADEHNAEWYRTKFIPMIYMVGGVLIGGTIITFIADLMGVAEAWGFRNAIIFGLGVATIKAVTVIYIFMHLKWDLKFKTISLTMLSTIIFFVAMMWLTVGSEVKTVEGNSGKPGKTDNTWNHGEHAIGAKKTDEKEEPAN